jgi:peptidoglycan/LPS O-acetylase OafA/YrhL
MSGEQWRLGHRPGLDGARGLAIALVLAGHALPSGFAAGSVGVALFFVLSGFLITSLLLEERSGSGKIDLKQFYERRIRRLLPAFVVFWIAVLAGMIVIGQAQQGLFNGVVAASYVGNWVEAAGTWLGPLTHTWSLAIEEQFYLVWPVVLILALRYIRVRRLAVVLIVLAVAVELGRAIAWTNGVPWVRLAYGTDLQADGLLLGCALAIIMHTRPISLPQLTRPIALAALVAIAFAVPNDAYRFVGDTAAVLISAALVAALVAPSGTDVVFGNRALGFLGVISYGLYLWHFPILWFMGFTDSRPYPGPLMAIVGIALSVAVAVASYVWVEQRFRRRSTRGQSVESMPAPEPAAA